MTLLNHAYNWVIRTYLPPPPKKNVNNKGEEDGQESTQLKVWFSILTIFIHNALLYAVIFIQEMVAPQ